jgi:ribosomal protein S12 methylthiotransferase
MGQGPSSAARIYLHTLGCPKNEADSRAVARSLGEAGVILVSSPEEATHLLLNTCGFIQPAKEESIGAILDACAAFPDKQVLVMGCLVERYRKELAEEVPEVAGWFGVVGSDTAREVLGKLAGRESTERLATGASAERALAPGPAYAYLKISDGCDEPCTFCAIPGIKGPYRSVSAKDILREADAVLSQGARELVLVGQDTAIWTAGGLDLAGLIRLLAADERAERIRVMYLQPEHLTDSFLQFMAGQPKLCRYLDLPFQHSHPEVLRRMGRSGSGRHYLVLLAEARRLMPDVAIRSTFIVGFPGERRQHFEDLLAFVEEAGFDYAGGFVYSPEEGTSAATFKPRVGRREAQGRLNRLTVHLETIAENRHQKLVGSSIEVMIDSVGGEEAEGNITAVGRTAGQAPEVDGVTYIEGDLPAGTRPGDMVRATVIAAVGYEVVASYDAS